MAEMKTLNGYEVVDAKARQDIEALKEKEPDLSNYYTKAQTDSAIGEAVSGIKIPEVDLSPYAKAADIPTKVSELENDSYYATQGFVNQKIDDVKLDSYFLDFSKATDTAQAATERMVEFAEHLAARTSTADPDACAYIMDTHDNIYYPAMVQYKWENGTLTINLVKVGTNLNVIYSGSETTWDTVRISGNTANGWTYELLSSNSFTFASKDYVSQAIADSAQGETDLSNYYTKEEVNALFDGIAIAEEGSY